MCLILKKYSATFLGFLGLLVLMRDVQAAEEPRVIHENPSFGVHRFFLSPDFIPPLFQKTKKDCNVLAFSLAVQPALCEDENDALSKTQEVHRKILGWNRHTGSPYTMDWDRAASRLDFRSDIFNYSNQSQKNLDWTETEYLGELHRYVVDTILYALMKNGYQDLERLASQILPTLEEAFPTNSQTTFSALRPFLVENFGAFYMHSILDPEILEDVRAGAENLGLPKAEAVGIYNSDWRRRKFVDNLVDLVMRLGIPASENPRTPNTVHIAGLWNTLDYLFTGLRGRLFMPHVLAEIDRRLDFLEEYELGFIARIRVIPTIRNSRCMQSFRKMEWRKSLQRNRNGHGILIVGGERRYGKLTHVLIHDPAGNWEGVREECRNHFEVERLPSGLKLEVSDAPRYQRIPVREFIHMMTPFRDRQLVRIVSILPEDAPRKPKPNQSSSDTRTMSLPEH